MRRIAPAAQWPLVLRFGPALALLPIGLLLGRVDAAGLLAGLVFIGWVTSQRRLPPGIGLAGMLLGGVLLAAHQVPGFTPLPLASPQELGGSRPWTLHLSFDKALVAATLLGWWLGHAHPGRCRPIAVAAVAFAALMIVPLLALVTDVLGWSPKWPEHLLRWLAINLLVTSLAEELLFRALLQRWLIERLGVAAGVLLTALLFGAAHLPFSAAFAAIAALAGLAYGLAFHLSGNRLAVAVALHTAVNAVHLLLLTYPLP